MTAGGSSKQDTPTVGLRPVIARDPTPNPPTTITIENPPPIGQPAAAFADDWSDASRYALISEIARGGGGRIAIAIDRKLGRRVALKRAIDHEGEERLEREALVLARLEHPAIVPIHDAGYDGEGSPYYTMKLLGGQNLAKRIEVTQTFEQRLALLPAITTVADAMAYAHGQQVIHRDLKPGNVLVGDFGEVAVIDWGLGKVLGDSEPARRNTPLPGPQLTSAGAVIGTPAYMAPEQAESAIVDARADVYAIGAMVYHVLSGQVPYGDVDTDTTLARLLSGPPPPLDEREPRVPGELAAIVTKAMARDPGQRYPTAKELAEDLHRYQTGRLVAAHRYRIWTRIWKWARRHQATVAIAAAAGAMAVATVVVIRSGGADTTCVGLDAPAHAVWNRDVRARAEAAFRAVKLPYAAATWDRVVAKLDQYTDQVGAMRVDACKATRVTKDQPESVMALRMQCLDRRVSELGAVVAILASADRSVVDHAEQIVDGSLGRVADCADSERLHDLSPLPADPQRRRDAIAIEEDLDQLTVLSEAEKNAEWMARAPDIAKRAELVGYLPAEARARTRWAQALISQGKEDLASEQLKLAVAAADRSHDDVDRARALTAMVRIETEHRERFAVADALVTIALGAAERAADPMSQASLYVYRSHLAGSVGRDKDAVADAEHAVAIMQAFNGSLLVATQRALAEQYVAAGRLDDADKLFHTVIDQLHARYGTDDVLDIAAAWGGLANTEFIRGKFQHAIELEQKEVEIDTRLKDTNVDDWITARENLAMMKHNARQSAAAESELVALLADAELPHGKSAVTVGIAYNLGIVREGLGKLPEAAEAYRDSIKRGQALDPELPAIARSRAELGDVYLQLDKPADALPELDAAIAFQNAHGGAEALDSALTRADRGRALLALGQAKAAAGELALALEVVDEKAEPFYKGVHRIALAQALWQLGRKADAKQVADAARAWLEKAGPDGKDALGDLAAWERKRN